MIQSEILQLCDNNSSIDKYKNVIKFAKTYGVNEHTYRACSMQGKPAINMKNCIHQMTKYLRSNIDEEFSNDYYNIMKMFGALTDIICKKCDGKPKSNDTIATWINIIQNFIQQYYGYVAKYRYRSKTNKPRYGFKIHLLHHVCHWLEYFKISPAHFDEQRIEHLHVIINRAFKIYSACKGGELVRNVAQYVSLNSLLKK